MKLIDKILIDHVSADLARGIAARGEGLRISAETALASAVPLVVRRCIRYLDAHHDEFIDGHNGKEYFEIVDEILVKVKATLRELIEESNQGDPS